MEQGIINRKFLSQEWLKLIACVAMLLDHIGAVLIPLQVLRIVGRIAFPIYCFLLTEGLYHTKAPVKYGSRLAFGAVLAEIPFDLCLQGGVSWDHQNVMVTLFLGLMMGMVMINVENLQHRVLYMLPFMLAAELCRCDYGGYGIALIGLFHLTRQLPGRNMLLAAGIGMLGLLLHGGYADIFGLRIPMQFFAVLSVIPISLYSGEKATTGKALQIGFYLFYPAHLLLLWLLRPQ